MRETDVARDGRSLRVRDAGDPDGDTVLFFHATPGSRLDLSFADDISMAEGIRLVSFDRPGYGGSTPASFSLSTVARDAEAVADALGIGRFATLGQSGGGPFSLAAGAVLTDRVTKVGVTSGPGPFDRVPGAQNALDDNDTQALALLPDDVEGAARGFAAGFEPLVSLFRESEPREAVMAFGELLSPRDKHLVEDDRLATALGTSMKEALRQGASGGGWDNVAWVGPWDIDLAAIRAPVLLWYGDEDRFCPPPHGIWLGDNLPHARLVLREGEGHLGLMEHTTEVLVALTSGE